MDNHGFVIAFLQIALLNFEYLKRKDEAYYESLCEKKCESRHR